MSADVQTKLESVENEIKQHRSAENALKIKEQVKGLCNLNGGFSANGLWNIKKKVMKKHSDPPMAKKDSNGNLITTPTALRNLYLNEYIYRLRHRDINPSFNLLKQLKEDLWERRFNLLSNIKSTDWSRDQVVKVLQTMDINKARDPLGYSNVIFKPGVCGPDLEDALTNLANSAKKDMNAFKNKRSGHDKSKFAKITFFRISRYKIVD